RGEVVAVARVDRRRVEPAARHERRHDGRGHVPRQVTWRRRRGDRQPEDVAHRLAQRNCSAHAVGSTAWPAGAVGYATTPGAAIWNPPGPPTATAPAGAPTGVAFMIDVMSIAGMPSLLTCVW